jgi:vacuolar-type H+-ATPase subunit I/STV1
MTDTKTQTNPTSNIINVENLINSYNLKLDSLTRDLHQQKSMLQSILDNDSEYSQLAQEADKISKTKSVARQKSLRQSNAITIIDKTKEIKNELREVKIAMSDYLTQYITLSGSRQIEAPDGTLMDIIYSARLIKNRT